MKKLNDKFLKQLYLKCKENYPELSLDLLLAKAFEEVKENETDSFDKFKTAFLASNNINEYDYYTQNVDIKIKKYVEEEIFPQYAKNDQGHGIFHILEVIRRSFALKATLNLDLEDNLVYIIAACHDLGKYEEQETGEKHAIIAGRRFINDKTLSTMFNDKERLIIREAIEDHSSSLEEMPRSDYGKLVSSADRNTSIEMVFIRSFFVGKRKNPNQKVSDYLEFTLQRLRKRYSVEHSENMFFADETYDNFLRDMRNLLLDGDRFKKLYCEVNHITLWEHILAEETGEASYVNMFKAQE